MSVGSGEALKGTVIDAVNVSDVSIVASVSNGQQKENWNSKTH